MTPCELCIDPIDKPHIDEHGAKTWRACPNPATRQVLDDKGRTLNVCEKHFEDRCKQEDIKGMRCLKGKGHSGQHDNGYERWGKESVMDAKLEERFEKIAQDAVRAAELVDCEGTDFVAGLKIVELEIRSRREMAAEEFGDGG